MSTTTYFAKNALRRVRLREQSFLATSTTYGYTTASSSLFMGWTRPRRRGILYPLLHQSYNGYGCSIPFSCSTTRSFASSKASPAEAVVSTSSASASTSSASASSSAAARVNNNNNNNTAAATATAAADARAVVSKEDEHREEYKRKRLSDVPISEVLQAKHSYRWVDPVIYRNATVREAIEVTIEGGLSGMMVLENDHKRVVGLLTSRDLLRISASGFKEGETAEQIMNRVVGDFMTPISQVIFARPDETVGMCRTIMAKLGIKCLPVLSREGRVEGLITARDMSDFGLSAKDKGGKESYLNDISERVGLSSNTSMAEPPTYMQAHLALDNTPLYANVGRAVLPHPFKKVNGLGRNMNDMRPDDDMENHNLSEDSHFVTTVLLPDEKNKPPRSFLYLGIADGVGSWREYGVDPREFSRRLMAECENVLAEASAGGREDGRKFRQVLPPAEVMAQAYERVKAENVIGSSTACIALFDGNRHQLHFSNLGDCGLICLRHIDSDVAGTLKRDRIVPRTERTSDLRVAFVSQQQLKSFNHPYQLGWTGEPLKEGESHSFKSARDSCTSSLHVRRGDIIIMATDGLFDNVELDDICQMALEWEQSKGFIRGGDIAARERRWKMGNSLTGISAEGVPELANALCRKARENSLNSSVDSPFAILAKENDIMWSGGMPDDCTVLVLHVVGRDAMDVMDAPGM